MIENEGWVPSEAPSDEELSAARWKRIADAFRVRIRNEEFHRWIAQAFLRESPQLAPMEVGRDETLEDNLRRLYSELTADERSGFRAALMRVIDIGEGPDKSWPPKSGSTARALLNMLRLARLSRHYGMLPWIGSELIRLMTQPKSMADLLALGDAAALLGRVEEWVPAEPGPDYRAVLASLHWLSQKLGTSSSLSFMDAALLLPAACYDKHNWATQVCAAIERYDIRREGVFPDTWPTFGNATSAEGVGLYDLRHVIIDVVHELDLVQFYAGIRSLAKSAARGDRASRPSRTLVTILCDEQLLQERPGIIHPSTPTPATAFVRFAQFARILYLGPRYVMDVTAKAFRHVSPDTFDDWFAQNWRASADLLDINYDPSAVDLLYPVAVIEGVTQIIERGEVPTRRQAAPREAEAALRSFVEFTKCGAAATIGAWSETNA